ncbi:hypothetical protein WDW86_20460 [Bdellovibrionota bacterium FG-2]
MKFRLLLALSFLVPVVSHAYIPPSKFIVNTIVSKRKSLKVVETHSKITAWEGEKALEGISVNHILALDVQRGVLRSLLTNSEGLLLYSIERKIAEWGPVSSLQLSPLHKEVTGTLKEYGIPIRTEEELALMKDEQERHSSEVEFLSRWQGRVAWVMGAKKAGAQLWVEKDTFLPLRLMVSKAGEAYDVRFENYRYYKDIPFARLLVLTPAVPTGSSKIIKEELSDISINPASTLPELKASPGHGWTEQGRAASAEVREMIETYYKIVR